MTIIFQNKNKKLSENESILLTKNNANCEIILELKSIVFDKQEGYIFLENVVRQMKVKKIKPTRLENLKYSFVDSDLESEKSEESEESEESEDEVDLNNKLEYTVKDQSSESENYYKKSYLSDNSNHKYNPKTDDDRLMSNRDNDDSDVINTEMNSDTSVSE